MSHAGTLLLHTILCTCNTNTYFIGNIFRAFSLGKEIDVPEISDAVAKQILIKCVATMTAHIGYESNVI